MSCTLLIGRVAVVFGLVLSVQATRSQAQPSPLDPAIIGNGEHPLQQQIGTGQLQPRNIGLSPCAPESRIAFSTKRPTAEVWSGRFRFLTSGTGGDWHLVITDADGVERERHQITDADTKAVTGWQTGLVAGRGVQIQLLGPATQGSACPRVQLAAEVQVAGVSTPRGQFGDSDDRWPESDVRFRSLQDATVIAPWRGGVAHLYAMSRSGRLLPCTGFFIAPQVFLTASHCIISSRETPGSIVFVGDRALTGSALKHIATDLPLDFTILWIETASPSTVLTVARVGASPFVLWQFPARPEPKVSVAQCEMAVSTGSRLSHTCDSSVGSSGSPIQVRTTGQVVGLHVEGCNATNATAKCVNHGIRMELIQARVKTLAKDIVTRYPSQGPAVLAAFGISP